MEDQLLADGITISPNPSGNWITINNELNIPLKNIVFFDIYGRMIHVVDQGQLGNNQTIDISGLSAGIYLMKIQGEEGSVTKRLVKR